MDYCSGSFGNGLGLVNACVLYFREWGNECCSVYLHEPIDLAQLLLDQTDGVLLSEEEQNISQALSSETVV